MLDIDSLVLSPGNHPPGNVFCVMEAVAFVAGEEWSAHPTCCSPVIATFLRRWGDALNDKERQKLKPYIMRCIGTRGSDTVERRRSYMCTDWLVRTFSPEFLEIAELQDHADALRQLPELVCLADLQSAQDIIRAAYADAHGEGNADANIATNRAAAGAAVGGIRIASVTASKGISSLTFRVVSCAASSKGRDRIAATITRLERKAFALLDRMIEAK